MGDVGDQFRLHALRLHALLDSRCDSVADRIQRIPDIRHIDEHLFCLDLIFQISAGDLCSRPLDLSEIKQDLHQRKEENDFLDQPEDHKQVELIPEQHQTDELTEDEQDKECPDAISHLNAGHRFPEFPESDSKHSG